MDWQINRNERYKSTRYFYKCKFINVYINSFSIKNKYFKLLKAECTRPRLLKCDLCPGRVLRWRTKKRSACCCCGLRGLCVWSNSAHILNKNCLIIASPHLAHSHGPTPSHQPGYDAGPVLSGCQVFVGWSHCKIQTYCIDINIKLCQRMVLDIWSSHISLKPRL